MSIQTLDVQSLPIRHRSVSRIMGHVMLALIPGTVLYAWLMDVRVLTNLLLAVVTALCVEALLLHLRERPVIRTLCDGSIVLAAWLLALCVPPSLPAWQLMVGVLVMASLGKHLFGGLGHNPFNPAMVAYAILIISFPVTMTDWQPANGLNRTTLDSHHSDAHAADAWDGVTSATPLDRLRALRNSLKSPADSDPGTGDLSDKGEQVNTSGVDYSQSGITTDAGSVIVGTAGRSALTDTIDATGETGTASQTSGTAVTGANLPVHVFEGSGVPDGSGAGEATSVPSTDFRQQADELIMQSPWKWISAAWLAGGIYLMLMRVISWHIPLSVLLSLSAFYYGLALVGSDTALPAVPALLSGAIMLGAFFIATDPVSAAASKAGKLLYGAGIGLFTGVIREYSSYPEGLAFAVLLMNTCVPLIDHVFTGPASRTPSGNGQGRRTTAASGPTERGPTERGPTERGPKPI